MFIYICMCPATCSRRRSVLSNEVRLGQTHTGPTFFHSSWNLPPGASSLLVFHHLPIGFALRLDSAHCDSAGRRRRRNPIANICSTNTGIFSRNIPYTRGTHPREIRRIKTNREKNGCSFTKQLECVKGEISTIERRCGTTILLYNTSYYWQTFCDDTKTNNNSELLEVVFENL